MFGPIHPLVLTKQLGQRHRIHLLISIYNSVQVHPVLIPFAIVVILLFFLLNLLLSCLPRFALCNSVSQVRSDFTSRFNSSFSKPALRNHVSNGEICFTLRKQPTRLPSSAHKYTPLAPVSRKQKKQQKKTATSIKKPSSSLLPEHYFVRRRLRGRHRLFFSSLSS